MEIPDLSQLYIDIKLEEVDRGRMQLGQTVKIRVDAIPDKEFTAELDYVSPIAALVFKGGSTPEKTFPARATLKNLDDRLRPGMSATAEIIIEKEPNQLLIPTRASFDKEGKPAVYVQIGKNFVVRHIQIGKRNDEDIVVTGGLKDGEIVTLESPAEAAKKSQEEVVGASKRAETVFHEKSNFSFDRTGDPGRRRLGRIPSLQADSRSGRTRFPPRRCRRVTWSSAPSRAANCARCAPKRCSRPT